MLGCAAILDLGESADGVRVAELGAFVVHPAYRRSGFGDSLLDYVEQELRQKGFRRVAIVAGEGSYEWFAQVRRVRGCSCDPASQPSVCRGAPVQRCHMPLRLPSPTPPRP